MKRTAVVLSVLALAATAAASPATASPPPRPDTACMQAGLSFLREAGLLSSVAKDGLPISTALAADVSVRGDADISGVPDPIPLSILLADHRAGSNSLFVYPWCS